MSLFFLLGHFSIWRQVSVRIIEQFRFWEIEKKSTAYVPLSLQSLIFFGCLSKMKSIQCPILLLWRKGKTWIFLPHICRKSFESLVNIWKDGINENMITIVHLQSKPSVCYGILRLPVDLIKFLKKFLSCKQVWFFIILVSHWRCSGVFIANFKHISRIVLVYPILTLKK